MKHLISTKFAPIPVLKTDTLASASVLTRKQHYIVTQVSIGAGTGVGTG